MVCKNFIVICELKKKKKGWQVLVAKCKHNLSISIHIFLNIWIQLLQKENLTITERAQETSMEGPLDVKHQWIVLAIICINTYYIG